MNIPGEFMLLLNRIVNRTASHKDDEIPS